MKKSLLYIASVLLFAACDEQTSVVDDIEAAQTLMLSASVDPFLGETDTRANLAGTQFENNDWIRVKLICPFTNATQQGESYDNSYNGFWLMKYDGTKYLTNIKQADGCDIDGDFKASDAANLNGQILSQQTPYVFVAQTWTEEKPFYVGSTRYLHYSYSFQADQSAAGGKAYKKNDLLWAQQFMQTGSQFVHLTFQHKMAALKITIDDTALTTKISTNAVLTLEGMPDIDQMEVVVGDYYADQDVYGDRAYGYKQQASCKIDNNGKVLGVVVLDHTAGRAKTYALSGATEAAGGEKNNQIWGTIPNTGIYKAYHDSQKVYRMIVPPCTLDKNPVFYLRDGERRFKLELDNKKFEQGVMYSLTMKLQ